MALVEDALGHIVHFIGQGSIMDLQPQALFALKARDKPGFGKSLKSQNGTSFSPQVACGNAQRAQSEYPVDFKT